MNGIRNAYTTDMAVLRQYLMQGIPMALFISLVFSWALRSPLVAPTIDVFVLYAMSAIIPSAYDDQNNWGTFRITLPMSRRDAVIARYLVAVTLAGIALALGFITFALLDLWGVAIGLWAAASVPQMALTFMGAFAGVFVGSLMTSFCLPLLFKFGTARLTQMFPFIVLIITVVPVMIGLQFKYQLARAVFAFMAFVAGPYGATIMIIGFTIASLIILAISAGVSIRTYEKREL